MINLKEEINISKQLNGTEYESKMFYSSFINSKNDIKKEVKTNFKLKRNKLKRNKLRYKKG